MLTAAIPGPAVRFTARSVVAGVLIFGLLRLTWIEAHVLLPLTRLQASVAAHLFGTDEARIDVTLACSGAEALAACLAATLAYPATGRTRLAGILGGVGLIGLLNTVRIGTLGRASASPVWFDILHVYLWPAALTLAVVGYVFTWMALADRRTTTVPVAATSPSGAWLTPARTRFVVLTVGLLVVFTLTSAFHLRNPDLLGVAAAIAQATALVLGAAGVSARAASNVLWTSNGGFVVTPECVVTPLMAVYLAAVLAYASTWPRATLGVAAMLPLFAILAVVRLLAVALPASVEPLFLVHAFYQMLVAAVAVWLAARWRHSGRCVWFHALAGVGAGVLLLWLAGPLYSRLITQVVPALPPDPQAALTLLPSFQVALYASLLMASAVLRRWRAGLAGLAVLGLTQVTGLLLLQLLHQSTGITMHVAGIRAWAIVTPILAWLMVVTRVGAIR